MNRTTFGLLVAGLAVAAPLPNAAWAQSAPTAAPAAAHPQTTRSAVQVRPRVASARQILEAKLDKPLTVDIKESTLASVLDFFSQATGVTLDVMWIDDKNNLGLAKESQITLKADRVPAIKLLGRILEKASSDAANSSGTGGIAWQLSEEGTIEIGPKERLNAHKRTEMYDVNDLLIEIHDFTGAPTFDLSQTTQDGGGGSQSPFQGGNNNGNNQTGKSLEERGQDLIKIITDTVESEQWQDNGGNGASVKFWRGSLIINAPEYIHRQIDSNGKLASTTLKLHLAPGGESITRAPVAGSPQLATSPEPSTPAEDSTTAQSQPH